MKLKEIIGVPVLILLLPFVYILIIGKFIVLKYII